MTQDAVADRDYHRVVPRFEGACHCGAVSVVFDTEIAAEDLELRLCQCSFCRQHGATAATDPHGSLQIEGDPILYRFGLRIADFLICRHCGVFVAAFQPPDRATLNVNILRDRAALTREPIAANYGEEDTSDRQQRRRDRWTPAVLAHRRA